MTEEGLVTIMIDHKIIPLGNEQPTERMVPLNRHQTPSAIRGGQAGWIIRRDGEALDESAEIERLERENFDMRRRLSALDYLGSRAK